VRLWSEVSHRARPEQAEPEIRRVDLAGAVLQLLAAGEKDVMRFPWLEPPREATVAQALALLRRLGAITDGEVTDLGRAMVRLPVHPRLSRLLVEGQRHGEPERVALAAALLAERDPFLRDSEGPREPRRLRTLSDVLDRVEALEEFERDGRTATAHGALHRGPARFVLHARDQLLRSVQRDANAERPRDLPADEVLLRSLLAAFPDRVARRREPGGRRGVMVGGRGVVLAPSSGVLESELFVCVDVDASRTEALVRQASAVQRDWLPLPLVSAVTEVMFSEHTERVTARRRLRYEDLLLEESPAAFPYEAEVARVLCNAASERLERVLPPDDSAAGLFLRRVRWLREWMPELNLPAFDTADLREVLPWLCPGMRAFEDLRRADWLAALQGRLTHQQLQAIEREAPERLAVPSGSQIALTYEPGRPPVLALRIQEIFGLRDTPTVAAGRVRVLLHLLAPNFRPQQVTDDLASFWANTYPVVRKELRARYPKHAWPEDPLSAPAQRGAQRRGKS
jgi:ATP-dependent helicase HrpB